METANQSTYTWPLHGSEFQDQACKQGQRPMALHDLIFEVTDHFHHTPLVKAGTGTLKFMGMEHKPHFSMGEMSRNWWLCLTKVTPRINFLFPLKIVSLLNAWEREVIATQLPNCPCSRLLLLNKYVFSSPTEGHY